MDSFFHFFWRISSLTLCWYFASAKNEISIYAVANLNDPVHITMAAAQWLAINEINNDTSFLSNYTLKLQIADCEGDASKALINIIPLGNNAECASNTTTNAGIFPITLSGTRSSISALTTSVLNAMNIAQIAASSTSTDLSDTQKYPYFYRTIPSDLMQANGLILLCKRFNWTKIGIVYIHDTYGLSLSVKLHQLAKANDTNIDVTSVAISYEEDKTYSYAAHQLRELEIFIIVAIIHGDKQITSFFKTFNQSGMLGYPYYYIGVDAWIHSSFIQTVNTNTPSLKNKVDGFIGCTPFQPHNFNIDQYDNDTIHIMNTSLHITSKLYDSWKYYQLRADNEKIRNLQELEGNYMVYAYDAMYVVAHSINIYVEKYGDYDLMEKMNENPAVFLERLNRIVLDINFTGATGQILFDQNGDRVNGLYAFGNTDTSSNSSISYFGYFYQTKDGEYKYNIDEDAIVWPPDFREKGIIPHSEIIIYEKVVMLQPTQVGYILISIATLISIIITVLLIVLLFYYRNNGIIKAASVYLNIFRCFGGMIGFCLVILFVVDEAVTKNTGILTVLCNVRLCLLCIGYTMIFMPMFVKLYRLSHIFNQMLEKKNMSTIRLFVWILLCLLLDIILLAIFFGTEPLQRIYIKTDMDKIDALQYNQNVYTSCAVNKNTHFFIVVIIIWKLFQHSFGFSVALNVAKISGSSLQYLLARFDETGVQLFTIIFTFISICITVIVFVLAPISPTFFFTFLTITLLLIIDLTLWLTICPRIIAVMRGKEEKYKKSAKQKLKEKIRADVRSILEEEEQRRSSKRLSEAVPDALPDTLALPTAIRNMMQSTSSDNYSKLAEHIEIEDNEVEHATNIKVKLLQKENEVEDNEIAKSTEMQPLQIVYKPNVPP